MVKGLGERLQKQRLLLNISQKEAAIVIGASASSSDIFSISPIVSCLNLS